MSMNGGIEIIVTLKANRPLIYRHRKALIAHALFKRKSGYLYQVNFTDDYSLFY